MRKSSYYGAGSGSGLRVTVKDVARVLGVSPSTVSNAYNRPDQLSKKLRERVFEVAREMGYAGPDPLGRSLRRRRSDAVGVLFGDRLSYVFADPAAMQFLEGFSEAIEGAGLGLVMLPGVSAVGGDEAMVRSAAIDGVLIHSMASDDPLVAAVMERRLPVVVVDQPVVVGVPSVSVDDVEAGRLAAEHLLELGHERIAVIATRLALDARSGPAGPARQKSATVRPSRERLGGISAVMEEAGLSWGDVVVYECSESTLDQGKAAAVGLLSASGPPTAMIALSDQLAFGAMEAAEDLGLSLPEDLSVIGFDDVPAAELTTPTLTTLHQPHAEKGLMAGRRLIARLDRDAKTGEDDPAKDNLAEDDLLLPTRLVVRDSTAKPR
ncbi:substrate-binding domain-containing protein [Rubrobacter indicoceani]|uniref:LacI family DNA-binding transcriptional regulator n=1 Tax=Rubrobacter indicoceani TaxID=2051957 RepID=UPI000E5A8D9F|nr:substrate-binding domain-containing protein [Rubrobacter indicoceani]